MDAFYYKDRKNHLTNQSTQERKHYDDGGRSNNEKEWSFKPIKSIMSVSCLERMSYNSLHSEKYRWRLKAILVLSGLIGTIIVVVNHFRIWSETPYSVFTEQIPIEDVDFPAITICPMDATEFGFVENEINTNAKNYYKIPFSEAFVEILLLLRNLTEVDESSCLLRICDDKVEETACSNTEAFEGFMNDASYAESYGKFIFKKISQTAEKIFEGYEFDSQYSTEDIDNVDRFFPSAFAGESFKLGSLLRFLFVQSGIDANMQGNFYRKYLHGFTKGWSFEYGHSVNLDAIPLPVLIRTLDGKPDNENRTENLEGIKFSRVLSSVYVQSRHPPHIFDFFKGDRVHLVSGGMIPFCWYGNENIKSSGIKLGPYGNRYCHTFQETFNENGLCYTYNARYLNTNGIGLPDWRTKYFEAKKVAGIGPDKGLRLIIDSSKIAHKAKSSQHLSGGFDVFIGDPGSVTQYARYRIYPDSNGEYSFRMQSSSIEASNEDIDSLSKQDKLCSSRNAQNLKYVRGYYSRSSCLMECIIARVSEECGCAPWFVNQTKYPICNSKGNQCYHDKRSEFHEGEQCHCRPDCVRHNFFVTMSFVERKFSESKGYYYNPQDSSGILADYLLDPQHFFQDEIVHNLTKLLYNYSNEELAEKRFEEDISILNFYFDTIYTTKITKTLRWTIWDKIATLGGSLCFFIGLSILSAAELVYWFLSFVMAVLKKWFQNSMNLVLDMGTKNVEATVPVRRERMVFVNNVQIHPRTPLPQMTDVS